MLLGDYEKVKIFKFIGKVINESIRAGGQSRESNHRTESPVLFLKA